MRGLIRLLLIQLRDRPGAAFMLGALIVGTLMLLIGLV